MFDLDALGRWDAGLARLEVACPRQLRDLYREIIAHAIDIKRENPVRTEREAVAA